MAERMGWELPMLLMGAFRALVDELHADLAQRGHPEARPLHGFALQAVGADGATASELGRRLGVSKQAAAKTVAGLERLGYVAREPDARDARAQRVVRTAQGAELLALSAETFGRLRARWRRELGPRRLRELEDGLEAMIGAAGAAKLGDLPGWMR
jgi:DNA-binding MarR family transcriptional regulator